MAEDNGNEAMALLGRYADRQGYSMNGVAKNLGVGLRAVQRYFEYHSRPETVANLCRALGKDRLTAQALSQQLNDRDVEIIRRRIGIDFPEAREALRPGTGPRNIPKETLLQALRAYVIAEQGLDRHGLNGRAAFAETLRAAGFSIAGEVLRRRMALGDELVELIAGMQQVADLTDRQTFIIGEMLQTWLEERDAGNQIGSPSHVFDSKDEIESFKRDVLARSQGHSEPEKGNSP